MTARMWINETVAFASGCIVAAYITRDVSGWASAVLFIILAAAVAMVVDGASNGTVRLAIVLDGVFNDLESKIAELESSIDELTRRLR